MNQKVKNKKLLRSTDSNKLILLTSNDQNKDK